MVQLILALGILAITFLGDAYKILVAVPMPGRSHGILGYGVVKNLLEAGHEVTYITVHVQNNSHPKLQQIDVSSNEDIMPKNLYSIKELMVTQNLLREQYVLWQFLHKMQVNTIENPDVQKLLRDPTKKFDLVITEWIIANFCNCFAAVFDAPLIWLGGTEPHSQILRYIDEELNPAYNADLLSVNVPPLNFIQRVDELWKQIIIKFLDYFVFDDAERIDYERLIAPIIQEKGRQPPSYIKVKYNVSLVLGNAHVSLGEATKIPQSFKPVGGYHIDRNVKALPKDLQKLFDNATNGVIYFSMGSNLKSKDLPTEVKNDLLKVFSRLKQTVLWKFEEEVPDLPKNVHVVSWAPQESILSHPNCILFITHGGLLSVTEAIHFGIPLIGIPAYADQFINVDRAVSKGFAKKVTLSYNMAADLEVALADILTDRRYTERAKELSLIYHDRPVTPGAELVHWVEHVVRTRGAVHLRSPALLVPWYQKMYLDLAALVIIALTLVILFMKRLYTLIFSSNNKKLGKKKIN